MKDALTEALLAYRKKKGVKLKDMQQLTGIDIGTLSRIETGQREIKLKEAAAIAEALQAKLFFKIEAEQEQVKNWTGWDTML